MVRPYIAVMPGHAGEAIGYSGPLAPQFRFRDESSERSDLGTAAFA
jgi:hypothetical protein